MSFIKSDNSAKIYAPGYFIARGDETIKRETREIKQSGAITADNGAKYVPMGTIYPANDATAEGIVYEDVDVTTGDMPGSVVLDGCVYTERLAMTGYNYDSVTVGNYVSPKEKEWYERSGTSPNYVYTLSTDTTANSAKTYYAKSGNDYNAVTVGNFVNPKEQGWYESDGEATPTYTASTDTTAAALKTYYTRSIANISSAAKTALQSKGFVFIDTVPAVTRPY